jgi:hypothetical protein
MFYLTSLTQRKLGLKIMGTKIDGYGIQTNVMDV